MFYFYYYYYYLFCIVYYCVASLHNILLVEGMLQRVHAEMEMETEKIPPLRKAAIYDDK